MIIKVAVGVIQNSNHEVLLAQRKSGTHQAGKWEFAGGKVDPGETSRNALTRELHEELGIDVKSAVPLIRIHHQYTEYKVILDVWKVLEYTGELHGKEEQAIKWVPVDRLAEQDFPAANHPIVTAIRLPHYYVITPPDLTLETLPAYLKSILQKKYTLIRFRADGWVEADYEKAIPIAAELCDHHKAQLIIDGKPEWVERFNVAGLHLKSAQLSQYHERPITKNKWLGVSCHNEKELIKAKKIEADFALLSPVLPTPSHPDAKGLSWPAFSKLTEKTNIPIYAMGGMTLDSPAIWFGAQGVAGLSMFKQE